MSDNSQITATYFSAWKSGDFATLRSVLDDAVTFRGTLGTADGIEECLAGLQHMSKIMTDIVIQKVFVDGDDVLTWYDLHSSVAPPVPTANWCHLDGGRIAAIRATFDGRPFST